MKKNILSVFFTAFYVFSGLVFLVPITQAQESVMCSCDIVIKLGDGRQDRYTAPMSCQGTCLSSTCLPDRDDIVSASCVPLNETTGDPEVCETTGDPEGSTSGGQTSNADFVKDVPLVNPITGIAHGESADPFGLIAQVSKNIINTLLGLVGIFAMIGFIWGGVTWMTSYGDTAKIERGKKMMTWGVAGLIVIFSSYAIANYIFQAIGATGAATTATTPVNLDNDLNQLLEPLN